MKIIDLLNKIANAEEVPKKIRIDHWCYKFEWIEHEGNYYDKYNEIDLMSCLSCDKEELNYEVHEIEEEKKIPEKLTQFEAPFLKGDKPDIRFSLIIDQINEIIDYLKSKGSE